MYIYIFYILFIFMFLFMILFYNFSFSKDINNYEIKTFLIDELQTGDILITDYQNINNFVITSFFGENFMHPTIIIRENDEVYVLDYISRKGLLKRPIITWYKYNHNSIVGINKLECSQYDRDNLKNKLNELYNYYKPLTLDGPPGFNISWRRFWWPSKKFHTNYEIKKMVCLEIVVLFLIQAGVINKNRSIESYLPRDFEKMKGFSTTENYKFKEFNLINSIIF